MASTSLSIPIPQALKSYAALIPILILLAYRFAANFKEGKSLIPTFVPGKSSAGSLKKRWLYDCPNLLQEAYTTFDGKPFKIWTTEGDQVVIPPDYVDELKMLPDKKFPSALRNFFLQDYLWPIDSSKLDFGHVVMKNDLNKNMGSIFPDMKNEVDSVLPLEFPGSKEWRSIQVYPKVLRCVARVNAKIFVGSNLHLNQEWIEITCSYVRNIFLSSAKLRFFPAWLRPGVQYFVPELRAVWRCNSRARDLLAPILRDRETQEERAGYLKPNDSIEWLRDLVPQPDRRDAHFHGISQLGISAVSVNTTSQLITNAIFNLCTWPEYVPMLREEIECVLKDYGGEWTLESMGKLQKLDSFLKETLRHSGHLTATFQRKALQPITLSDGTHIPPGTMTFSPANAINFDPDIYPDPEKFDGLRFYKLRQASEGDANRYQLTSITKTQLQFGSGRHACPGRWFAAHQNKLVVAAVIQQYEIKFKDGEGRPKGILFQTNQFPDPKAEVLFRTRKFGIQGT